MNYLAHIYLSRRHPLSRLGGFAADAVKGKSYMDYPPLMREGILLHRRIDRFTDEHPITRKWVAELQPHFGRYSGVLLDVFFDYLLASDFVNYTGCGLRRFAWQFNASALWYYPYLPKRIKRFIFHFVLTNRLWRYRTPEGVRMSLEIMVLYRGMEVDPSAAESFLMERSDEMRGDFVSLWQDLLVEARRDIG